MVRAGAVVAQGFCGVAAHEDGAGVANVFEHGLGVFDRQLQVLRGDAVGDFGGLFQIGDLDQRGAVGHGGADDVGALHGWQQFVDAGFDGIQEFGIRADQDGLGLLVVFCLGEQVHGDPVGVGFAVADHEDFRGAGDHVDADNAEDFALGGGDENVAGADDFINGRNGFCAIGERAHGLGTANGEDPVNTGNRCGGQDHVIHHTIRCRNNHHDFTDTRDLCGNGVHEHG